MSARPVGAAGGAPTTRARASRGGRGVRLRRVTARAGLLVRRRARRDLGLLAATTALVALAALLAVAGPRIVATTLDDATVQTVRGLGGGADPVAIAEVRAPVEDGPDTGAADPATFLALPRLADEVPEELRAVTADVVVSLDLGTFAVLPEGGGDADGAADEAAGEAADEAAGEAAEDAAAAGLPDRAAVALLAEDLADDVEVVAGRLPAGVAADGAVEAVVPEAAADAGLEPGTRLALAARRAGETGRGTATVVVVGVVRPADAGAPVWRDLAAAWAPEAAATPPLLVAEAGAERVLAVTEVAGFGVVRTILDPEAFTLARARAVVAALEEVRTDPRLLTAGAAGVRVPPLGLGPALAAHLEAVPAARAQMSVPVAGVVGVAALVLVLVSRLLVRRRAGAIGLERARGASVPSVVLRLGAEAVVVVALGVAAGVLAADRLAPGGPAWTASWWTLAPVAVVGLLATPLQGAAIARAAWTGRREPANRRERARIARRRDLRRVAAEVGVVLLAAGAGWSLRSRGLVGGVEATGGGDPFLVVAPLLVALAATVVALRVYPWPVRAAAAVGRRSRGVLGVVGAVRAQRALAPLPLLALTVATSVAATGLLLVHTVRVGQEAAAWERVGAEVRVESPEAAAVADAVRDAPGVTAVAVALTANAATLDLGAYTLPASLLAVDAGYADVLAALPDPPPAADRAALADLSSGAAAGTDGEPDSEPAGRPDAAGPIPVVVDTALATRLDRDDLSVTLRGTIVPLVVVGTTDHAPRGLAPGPFVFADLGTTLAHLDDVAPDTVWVQGPGAEAAAADAAAELGLPADAVRSRAAWAAERRAMALVAGVERIMLVATGVVGLLAVLALGATVVAGAGERGRTLSLLRTLGMRARLGWWLALAELAPVVLAAVVAGSVSGALVVLALGGALGLDVLVGGVDVPAMAVSPEILGGLCAGSVILLLVAAFVEVAVHRRDRLSEVLRVGETTT